MIFDNINLGKSKPESDDEYEYVKVKKNQKSKVIYENDSTSSEERQQPSKKIVIESQYVFYCKTLTIL